MKIGLATLCAALSLLPSCSPFQRIKDVFKKVDVHMGIDYIDRDAQGYEVRTEIWSVHDIEEKMIIMSPNIDVSPTISNTVDMSYTI